MTYHNDTAIVLIKHGYISMEDFHTSQNKDGTVSLEWLHADPKPTEADIAAEVATQEFADWFAENISGDPVRSDPVKAKRRKMRSKEIDPAIFELLEIINEERAVPISRAELKTRVRQRINRGDEDNE